MSEKPYSLYHCNKCESELVLKQKQFVGPLPGMYYWEGVPFCPKCQKWRNKATMHYSYDCTKENTTP